MSSRFFSDAYRSALGSPYPIKVGDPRGVVVEISLGRDGLDYLVHKLPWDDGFTEELRGVWQVVQERDEADTEEGSG